jgi:hypothetical protein
MDVDPHQQKVCDSAVKPLFFEDDPCGFRIHFDP